MPRFRVSRLFARQSTQLVGRAAPAFLKGLDVLHLSRPGIPDFAELSQVVTLADQVANQGGLADARFTLDADDGKRAGARASHCGMQ